MRVSTQTYVRALVCTTFLAALAGPGLAYMGPAAGPVPRFELPWEVWIGCLCLLLGVAFAAAGWLGGDRRATS